ncbi:glucose-6-phosphate dehydrogenase [Planomonospora venezuelensis]|uniref:Glucose-6-phosphate 1-dehydrogenase n=1 Tax=Planomonospora venezuelensis TaxID=1999 RepID=A0A841DC08_PLAVE|nr:glucose-6-phosphate dehydrogenase [Planomonospora venezuelensis]MBB5966343.1 glucose-6-phosphate 1-dehydrogenase [Planomonospora venezuelensis]GIM99750.1 glucose-6-phosphate 1-dehydrogenase [Planomonospora venezuelensis]
MSETPQPADLIVFGGTGDLSMRKLLPALYHCDRDGLLAPETRIIAMSRGGLDDADFRGKVDAEVRGSVPVDDLATWQRFLGRLHHISIDISGEDSTGWAKVTALLAGHEQRDRVFYLASPPMTFGPFCREAHRAGLVTPASRVVLEKPLGRDLASARHINDEVGAIFHERQIFRIDHYLGKETVQNLLVLRFANAFLEPIWNSLWIDHVQITAAETVGTPGRRGYYDHAGALRDMVQNHLLQLLCLVAMEPPARNDRESIRDEKVKVLESLRPITGGEVDRFTVRGQYTAGVSGGVPVPGYLDEPDNTPPTEASHRVETFAAIRAEVKNWRWAGVPFYLRTGKRMPYRSSEIVVQFKEVPHSIFPGSTPNRLVLRLQPSEGIRLELMAKEPGAGEVALKPVPLSLSFAETFTARVPDAYERLLMDVLAGNPTLFMRRDEVEAAWRWIDPILTEWESQNMLPEPYPAGTAGPAGAHELVGRSGRTWHEEGLA